MWALGRARASARRALGRGVSVVPGTAPRPPLLLVLDLDETLVRVSCEGVHRNRQLHRSDFRVLVDVGTPPSHTTFGCDVSLRPGLGAFLEWIKARRSAGTLDGPWVFTTATPNFTKEILKRIDPGGKIFGMRVLTREACSPARMPGFFLKDLARIPATSGEGGTRRAVLVDNNPVSHVLQPESSFLVRDWLGQDTPDSELARVRSLLDSLMEGGPDRETGSPGSAWEAPAAAGNYTCGLERLVPGHASFRERVRELGRRLDEERPEEKEEFRATLRSLSAELQDIKRELLGAAP